MPGGKSRFSKEVFQKMLKLDGAASRDPLTGIARKKYLETWLRSRLEETQKSQRPLGVLSFDLDHLKKVNYLHGHKIGDQVLQMVAGILINNIGSFDLVGRWGGQEFILIISNADAANLVAIAEKFRKLISSSQLMVEGSAVSVTISVGATMSRQDDSAEAVVGRAHQAMEKSKAAGRNCATLDCC